MTKLLISLVKNKSDERSLRHRLGVMSGGVGIFCNLLLCTIKFIVGTLSGSVSITADAFNNLSDAASSIVTIIGTRLSVKPVDKEHPFGHGRVEYISALIVSFLIFLMGFELAKSSVDKIIHPTELKFSIVYLIVILSAILVKLWMAYFNKKLYKLTENINLKAVAQDSLNDCISTGATIFALVISHFFNIPWIDGVIGLCVAGFVFFSGIGIVRDILGPLLGQPPEKELVDNIRRIMCEQELILGIHDLIVHDYGPGRIIASAHAEVPACEDVLKIHDVIDEVEQKINEELNIIICIHMDPVVTDDEELNEYKRLCAKIIGEYNPSYAFHDFRMVKGDARINLIFDVVIGYDDNKDKAEILKALTEKFRAYDERINLVVTLEQSFV